MKQFEVWRFNFPNKGEHPVVILSHTDLCAQSVVNVLYGTSPYEEQEETEKTEAGTWFSFD